MTIIEAVQSALFGISSCLRDREVRKLAAKPWALGLLVYLLTAAGALYSHAPLMKVFTSAPVGFWRHVTYWLIWTMVTLGLIAASSLISVVVVFAATGLFQTGIARHVLSGLGAAAPPADSSVAGEIGRTIFVEGTKLFWIIPLAVLIFVGGFIPVLAPLCFILSAWLLAFQSCDIVLDLYKVPLLRRLKLALGNAVTFTCFGAPFLALSMVPFAGFLVPPLAAAGAARFLASHSLLQTQESTNKH